MFSKSSFARVFIMNSLKDMLCWYPNIPKNLDIDNLKQHIEFLRSSYRSKYIRINLFLRWRKPDWSTKCQIDLIDYIIFLEWSRSICFTVVKNFENYSLFTIRLINFGIIIGRGRRGNWGYSPRELWLCFCFQVFFEIR